MKKRKKIKIYEIEKTVPVQIKLFRQIKPFKTVPLMLSHSIGNCPRLCETISVHINLIHLNCPDNLKPLGPIWGGSVSYGPGQFCLIHFMWSRFLKCQSLCQAPSLHLFVTYSLLLNRRHVSTQRGKEDKITSFLDSH